MTYEFRQNVIVPGTVTTNGIINTGAQWVSTMFIENPNNSLTGDTWTYEVLDNDYIIKVKETAKYDENDATAGKKTIINLPDPLISHGREIVIEDSGGNASQLPITVQFIDKYTGEFDPVTGEEIAEPVLVYEMKINYEKIKVIADGSQEATKAWKVEQIVSPEVGAYPYVYYPYTGPEESYTFNLQGSIAENGGWIYNVDGSAQLYRMSITGTNTNGSQLILTFPNCAEVTGKTFYIYDQSGRSHNGNNIAADGSNSNQIRVVQRHSDYDPTDGINRITTIVYLRIEHGIARIMSTGTTWIILSNVQSVPTHLDYSIL